jgi:cytochrome oxidase Cu insertion factor (SCO1/SenC/PrrC family)
VSSRARTNPNRTWFVVIAIVVVIGIAAVAAVAMSGSGDDSSGGKATAHETAAVTVDGTALPPYTNPEKDAALGDTIPTLEGVSFDGSPVTIAPNGKPQVLIFLSHSCPHCQAEVPRIVELQRAGELAKGVDVTGIATNTSPDLPNYPPSAWLQREQWPFPVLADSKSGDAGQAFGLTAFPYFVFVDADGRVVGRATGEIAPESLVKVFEQLAKGASSSEPANGPSTSKDQ